MAFISEFKTGVLFKDLKNVEQLILEEYEKTITSNLINCEISDDVLAGYIDRFAKVIRAMKT